MFGQMNQMMQLMQAMRNPQQFLQRMGIPQENLNSPQDVEKFLLDQGKINQQQIDQSKQMYKQFFN